MAREGLRSQHLTIHLRLHHSDAQRQALLVDLCARPVPIVPFGREHRHIHQVVQIRAALHQVQDPRQPIEATSRREPRRAGEPSRRRYHLHHLPRRDDVGQKATMWSHLPPVLSEEMDRAKCQVPHLQDYDCTGPSGSFPSWRSPRRRGIAIKSRPGCSSAAQRAQAFAEITKPDSEKEGVAAESLGSHPAQRPP